MPDYHAIFRAPAEARNVELEVVSGSVPRELAGSLLRNGPGLQRAGQSPMHFLDGYAFVASARFEQGRVVYNARHVDLPLAKREAAEGRLLNRRPFTNRPGGRFANFLRLKLSTGASHDVYAWGGAVVASDVDGHYMLDPVTLDTSAAAPIHRMLGGLSLLSPMPRFDPWSGRLVAYVSTPGMVGADTVTFVELDASWKECARVERSLGMKGVLLHDLASTENHYIVAHLGCLSVGAAAGGSRSFIDAVSLSPGGSRILAIPRRGDGPVRVLPLPEGFQAFHIANAYEDEGVLVVDTTTYEGLLDFSPLYPPELRGAESPAPRPGKGPFLARHTLRLSSGEHKATVHREARGEAPSVRDDRSGRKHRFAYTSAQGTRGDEPVDNAYYWYHGVAKLDCDQGETVAVWDAGPRVYVAAPQFVARGEAEDDGWVLTWTHDVAAHRGELVVLDARDLARGPVARLLLPAPLPPASHVCWS
jgi:all-trans-8'-apo-beta-carotenal 15,15'-oxygenase